MKSHTLNVEAHFGSDDISNQHHELIEAMETLRRDIERGDEQQAAEALEQFLQFLNSYFLFHTFTEEKLMFDNNYPRDQYFRHVREHKEVILDLILLADGEPTTRFLGITATAPKARAGQLIDGFERWLREHIEKADGRLVEFLRAKGI